MVNHYSCSTYVYNQAKFNETRFILQITLFFDVHLIEMGVTVEREKKKTWFVNTSLWISNSSAVNCLCGFAVCRKLDLDAKLFLFLLVCGYNSPN